MAKVHIAPLDASRLETGGSCLSIRQWTIIYKWRVLMGKSSYKWRVSMGKSSYKWRVSMGISSGKLTLRTGKSPLLMGNSTISTGSFSIAILNYQMVSSKTGELSMETRLIPVYLIRIPCPQESILQTTIEPVGGQHLIWDWHAELGCCWRNPLQLYGLYGICLPLMFLGFAWTWFCW